jgi:lysozyme family protein
MLPWVAIATSLLPDLIKLIAGDKAETLVTDIANVVQKVTGTSDPAEAKQKLDTDPAISTSLQVQLANIALSASKAQYEEQENQRKAELAELSRRLDDVNSARTNLLDLAKVQSPISWVPSVVSLFVMLGFYALLWLLISELSQQSDKLSQNQLINICIGALVAAFSTVVNFWLGSSKGSQDKDQVQAAQTSAVLKQTSSAQSTANAAIERASATVAAAGAATGYPTGPSRPGAAMKTDASTNFSRCLDVVFREEGGYTNDPNDPGGPTNFGITIEDLRQWRGTAVTADDVKSMTKSEAQEIYRSKYWNPMQCDDLPNGIDMEVFDFGVNVGLREAVKTLQSVVGVTSDGSVGPITLSAAKAANRQTTIQSYSARRLNYYRALPGWPHFGAGWTNRTNAVEQVALNMATQDAGNLAVV